MKINFNLILNWLFLQKLKRDCFGLNDIFLKNKKGDIFLYHIFLNLRSELDNPVM